MSRKPAPASTPLAQFITDRLRELGLKQVDFCRLTGFDQGLLSKLQSSVITTVNLESALRLADGLKVSPGEILSLLGKRDADLLLKKLYGNSLCAECAGDASAATPEPVQSIVEAAQQAFIMGRDMTPVLVMLRHLSASRRTTQEAAAEHALHSGHS
jgi:transcriptional regulator with XRE-family HTH domain